METTERTTRAPLPPPRDRFTSETTPARHAARLAGVSYVFLFALGVFANFFVREELITADASETAANIADSNGLFRLGMAGFLVIFALDAVVAWALHIVFRSTNRDVSLLAAWFRIIYTIFLGVALVFFFQALQLLDHERHAEAFSPAQLDAQALIALDTFNSAWLIGLLAFGIHLAIIGFLMIRHGNAPRLLGVVLITAGAAYVLDTTANALFSNYLDYETAFLAMVAIPAVVAEGWFGIWLLLRGGKTTSSQG